MHKVLLPEYVWQSNNGTQVACGSFFWLALCLKSFPPPFQFSMGSPGWFLDVSGTSSNPQYLNPCLPMGLGLWGSSSDIAHGFSFGHCLLLFLCSSPSWVLSKEQFSGFPNSMRFYPALSALLFIEVSRRRTHNWCSPEQMFFREGCCMQRVPKISVTSREIWGQMLVFLWTQCCHLHFYQSNSLPAGQLPIWEGRKKQAEFGVSKLQPFGGDGFDFWAHIQAISSHWALAMHCLEGAGLKGRDGSWQCCCWEQERAFICVLNYLLEKSSY